MIGNWRSGGLHILPITALLLLGLLGCVSAPALSDEPNRTRLAAAESLIDAFYAHDRAKLDAALTNAPDSKPAILFYQGWAKGGNYKVLERKPCRFVSTEEAICAITVQDDLIVALKTGFWVTDTFHLTFKDGAIAHVRTSSNDPPDFELALEWVKQQQPDVMDGVCQGFFAGGPDPQGCARAMVKGFAAYRANHPQQ